jgi:tRNA G18 (ribose-2'-O)-methylase SpoU
MLLIFEVRKCVNPQCGLRYTILAGDARGTRCPACRSEAEIVDQPFGQQQVPPTRGESRQPRLEVLLDNIRSAWNVGSILRAADGAGVAMVHLCGVSPTPDQPKVAKTALGAEQSIPWQRHADGYLFCQAAAREGYRIWALEGGERAEDLFSTALPDAPLLLVVGNELTGVDPGILSLCERVVCLPMLGSKGSLNVAGAFTAAVYTLAFGLQRR